MLQVPCNSQQPATNSLQELLHGQEISYVVQEFFSFVEGERKRNVCAHVCVKVYRYLLRSNVGRNPHKAYRSLVQDTTVADNRNHYDLHQFDKRQEETLMASE